MRLSMIGRRPPPGLKILPVWLCDLIVVHARLVSLPVLSQCLPGVRVKSLHFSVSSCGPTTDNKRLCVIVSRSRAPYNLTIIRKGP